MPSQWDEKVVSFYPACVWLGGGDVCAKLAFLTIKGL